MLLNLNDQYSKNLLYDALSLVSRTETEVEVLAASQKIDVYSVPDPARWAERARLGLLGELSAEPSLFEPFHNTPSLKQTRRCLCKQLTWDHELERRAKAKAGKHAGAEGAVPALPFPRLVIIGPGRPETVLCKYHCVPVRPGVYYAVEGLEMYVVVLAELPRTRDTLLLRLLGSGRLLREALADLNELPEDAWERSIATPLLVHFRLNETQAAQEQEEDDMSAEIRVWYEDYMRNLRAEERQEGRKEGRKEGHKEGRKEGREEGRKDGERNLLLRLLRTRFGELPAEAVARIGAADVDELERWGDRVLGAQTLAEVVG